MSMFSCRVSDVLQCSRARQGQENNHAIWKAETRLVSDERGADMIVPHTFRILCVHQRFMATPELTPPYDIVVEVVTQTQSRILTHSQVDMLINKMRECLMNKAIPDRLAEMLEVSNDKD